MAAKATWIGSISFGLVNVPVAAYQAIGKEPGSNGELKDLCECCIQPFSQNLVCPAGKAKDSEAARKRGDQNLTPVVKGVLDAQGDWHVLPQAELDQIEEESKTPTIVVDFIDADEAPFFLSTGFYYLKAPSGNKAAEDSVALLHRALMESGRVATGLWAPRSVSRQVLIYDHGDALVMNALPFGAQVKILPPVAKATDPKQLGLALQLVDQATVSFSMQDHEHDPASEKRAELIEQALAGQPIKSSAPAPAAQTGAVDMEALLKASLNQ